MKKLHAVYNSWFQDGIYFVCKIPTSEVNLTVHDNRIKDKISLGRLDYADYNLGFKIHPCFVLDAHQFTPLRFADIKFWHRSFDMPGRMERTYRKQPTDNEES
ncbi:MAG: hypothetical protein WDM90_15580 [Ferruginibacter sp.]